MKKLTVFDLDGTLAESKASSDADMSRLRGWLIVYQGVSAMEQASKERNGAVANVVFPTGIDRRVDVAWPDRFDIYYGMAGNRIGAVRLDVPELLPPGGVADSPVAKV